MGHTRCVQGWLCVCVCVWWGCWCLCAAQGGGVFTHGCAGSRAMQGVWESTCGSAWGGTAACPRRGCVCYKGVWLSTAPVLAWQRVGSAGLCPGTSRTLPLLG